MTSTSRRRLPWLVFILAAIWAVILGTPEVRHQLLNEVRTLRTAGGINVSEDDGAIETLAARLPNDAAVQYVAQIAQSKLKARAQLATLDALINRFPKETWLVAARLQATFDDFSDDRLGGDFENRLPPPYKTPSPEKTKEPPSFTPAELARDIAMARRGQALEPDNAYFDLVLAIFLMAGYRDAEAYQALHEGSLKPRFDSHGYDIMQARIDVRRQTGDFDWSTYMMYFPTSLSDGAQFRSFMRLVSWEAWKWERAGRHAPAIAARADMARLFAKTATGRNTIISGLIGTAGVALSWTGNPARRVNKNEMSRLGLKWDSVVAQRLMAERFAAYAKAHGRPDVARETLQINAANARFRNAATAMVNGPFFANLASPLMVRHYGLLLLRATLIVQLAVMLLLMGTLAAALLFTAQTKPSARDITTTTSAGTAIWTLSAVVMWLLCNSPNSPVGTYMSDPTGVPVPEMVLVVLTACFYIFCIAPPLGSAAVCAVRARRHLRHECKLRAENSTAPPPVGNPLAPPDSSPFVIAFCSWSLSVITIGCIVAGLVLLALNEVAKMVLPANELLLTGAALLVLCYFGWLVKWRWLAPGAARRHYHYTLRCHHAALQWWLVPASLLYLLLALAYVPVRRQVDRQFERQAQMGEIAQAMEAFNASAAGQAQP